jgi:hypothetical protein
VDPVVPPFVWADGNILSVLYGEIEALEAMAVFDLAAMEAMEAMETMAVSDLTRAPANQGRNSPIFKNYS